MPRRAFSRAFASLALRVLGALSLLAIAADHLYEYRVDHYSVIPTIGTLFLLNGVGAIALALALALPLGGPVRPPYRRRLRSVAAFGGIALSAATLAGLLVSESTPLFGFMEVGYRPVVVVSIVAEGVAILALATFLGLEHLTGDTAAGPSTTPRSRSATMPRSSHPASSLKGISMKRLAIAIPVAAALAVAVAGVSGAFSSARNGHPGAGSASQMTMPMPTTTASGTATGPLRVELHQRVVRVKIMNFAFLPARVEVSPGTRVAWTNEDADPHTVTTDKPGFSSQALNTGQTYAHMLSRTGTFAYHCTIHPFMHGTVVVQG